jgi:hypothetical protein
MRDWHVRCGVIWAAEEGKNPDQIRISSDASAETRTWPNFLYIKRGKWMNRTYTLAVSIFLVMALSGCLGPTRIKGYTGADLPPDQVAVFKAGIGAVVEVDNNKELRCPPLNCEFLLRPGKHHFTIGLKGTTDSSGFMLVSKQPRMIELNLKAGQTYTAISVSSPDPLYPEWGLAITGEDRILYDDRAWIKRK